MAVERRAAKRKGLLGRRLPTRLAAVVVPGLQTEPGELTPGNVQRAADSANGFLKTLGRGWEGGRRIHEPVNLWVSSDEGTFAVWTGGRSRGRKRKPLPDDPRGPPAGLLTLTAVSNGPIPTLRPHSPPSPFISFILNNTSRPPASLLRNSELFNPLMSNVLYLSRWW